ncbi:NAD-dependent dehydratase [Burkholderia ubonensis]|nr:GDP-mannose 4,6-dehydratase [Burkholderia ubonensis]KVP82659.1 NAD-dependent dehydratase [Burkholderia ubonensis]KVT29255.1 NAD-dependent dehydratase [Burkholderia ubonensis]KVU26804.1 NAD-dependent dehydratase [Burkholderia ubonensis]KVW35707.1 NAD-dependent dehydratase [Burkholderia ubonensis]KVW71628.1 NAD-dependent dehydratase [Burkholderia ubonensis]
MLAGRKILVTGAGGFIGSHLVESLVKAGAEVTAMVRYGSASSWGNLEFVSPDVKGNFRVVAGNIDDGDFVMHAMQGIDVVCHLAALIAIPYSYIAPRSYVRTNVEGTLNVVEAARRLGVEKVVHTSTSEVYGTALRVPIDEDHPLQGQSPYSASKIGADKIAESYYRSFDTNVVTVRPFNTYGPRQSARAFIPTIISQALACDQIQLGSLTPERDMTFVGDTVAGFIAAVGTDGIAGETINLGTGMTYSIGHFAERILKLMNIEKPIVQSADRMRPEKSEVLKLVSNNAKARERMGWSPQVSLDDGLLQTIEFVKRNLHLYRPEVYTV